MPSATRSIDQFVRFVVLRYLPAFLAILVLILFGGATATLLKGRGYQAEHAADGQTVNGDIHANRDSRARMAVVYTRRAIEAALGR
mgnify:CR=1 FL=1